MLDKLKTVRNEVNTLAIASFIVLMLKVLWLNSIPEFFPHAAALGEIVDKLCASIVSSYLFFLIVVHFKSEQDKEAVVPYISSRINRIIGDCKTQLVGFQNASNVVLDLDNLVITDIENAVNKITPEKNPPLVIGVRNSRYATWLEFMNHNRKRTVNEISKTLQKINFLDAKLVKIISNIEDCKHFEFLSAMEIHGMNNIQVDLKQCAPNFFEYCTLVRELNEHNKSKLLRYSEIRKL